jgi:hypothetical protein
MTLVLQQNLNTFYSLGSICTARYGDKHTAVMKGVETIKKTQNVVFHMIFAINGNYMPKITSNVFFVRRKAHV